MIPRWMGSMPNSIAIGKTNGATITSNPEGSMNCPPISRITLTIIRNMIGPKPADNIALATCCGTCSSVRTCLRISAFAIINNKVTVSFPASNNVFLVSLWKNAVAIAQGWSHNDFLVGSSANVVES